MDFRLFVLLVVLTVLAGPARPYGGEGGGAPSASGSAAPFDPPVVKDLAAAIQKETDPDIRTAATVSLGQFSGSPLASAALSRLVTDTAEAAQVRAAAAVSLGNQGAPENAKPLQTLLRDSDPMLRRHAVLGMGMLQSPDVVRPLVDRLGDPDDGVRRAAARALAFSGDAGARAALDIAARSDENPLVRLESLRMLVQTAGAKKSLLDDVAKSDQDPEMRELARAATLSLGRKNRPAGSAPPSDGTTASAAATPPTTDAPEGSSQGAGNVAMETSMVANRALESAVRGAGALAAPMTARKLNGPVTDSVGTSGATTTTQTRRRVKLAAADPAPDGSDAPINDYSQSAAAPTTSPPACAHAPGGDGLASGDTSLPRTDPSTAAPGTDALTSTTALPRTTGTANGESGRTRPGEPITRAISRLAARLAPGAATADEQLRTMHELAPLIDQAAFQGSRVVPLSPTKGRWFLTAYNKISEHEPLIKTTFVNEQGAMFRAGPGQTHMPGSTYVVFRYQDMAGKPGVLNGIGAYTYTRSGMPVFKHFGLDGNLDTFSSPRVNAETCFRCHDNKESFNQAKDFTFDTFQKAKANGTVALMEQARTKVAAQP